MKLLRSNARTVRFALNVYPPLRGAGIRVASISPNFRFVRVTLTERPWNRNVAGVHFGGSLFAMTDPFWMLLLLKHLGRDHVIWDKAAEIDFRTPGRGTLSAEFALDDNVLADLRQRTETGEKVLKWFNTEVKDQHGDTVAEVRKQTYLRKKPARDVSERTP